MAHTRFYFSIAAIAASALVVAAPRGRLLDDQPVRFEQNLGQAAPEIAFLARGAHYRLTIAPWQNRLLLTDTRTRKGSALTTTFRGANHKAVIEPLGLLETRTSYFVGASARDWHTGIPNYQRLRVRELYPNIDLVFYGNPGQLEYDFVIGPHADPNVIQFDVDGTQRISIDPDGDLVLSSAAGQVRWKRPVIYQEDDGGRKPVAGGFVMLGKRRIGFRVGRYDAGRAVVIDPVLSYASYFGANGNEASHAIGADAQGNIYIAGITTSSNLPVTSGAAQTTYGGQTADLITGDAFVAKFNSTGGLVYLTFLGGQRDDGASSLAVDGAGNVYVVGATNSQDFPVVNAFQSKFGGSGGNTCATSGDAFITKLNPSGTQIIYSTYLGGNQDDQATSVAIDSAGNAYVGGTTLSRNFPVTAGVVQSSLAGSGGQPGAPYCDGLPGFVTGDGFVAKLNPAGSQLVFSTYLGGSMDDGVLAIALDSALNVYVAGASLSSDFPTTPGAFQTQYGGADIFQNFFFNTGDAIVAKLNPTGTALVYSTYVGGNGDDWAGGLVVDSGGTAYITGASDSTNLPTTSTAVQKRFAGYTNLPYAIEHDWGDAFVARLNASGSALLYMTYFGGSANDGAAAIAVDSSGLIYLAGTTDSSDFPVTANAAQATFGGDGGQFLNDGQDYQPLGDGFFAIINPNSTTPVYSTYFGGSLDDVFAGLILDAQGNAWITGNSLSTNLPVTANARQKTFGGYNTFSGPKGDSLLVSYSNPGSSGMSLTGIQNGAGYQSGVVSPGMVFVLYGNNIGPSTLVGPSLDATGKLATTQAGVTIKFNGVAAPIVYVDSSFMAGIVPYEVATSASAQVVVTYNGASTPALTVPVAGVVPGLYAANSAGSGQAAAYNSDFSKNSSANPAAKGTLVVLYGTGEGISNGNPPNVDGMLGSATSPTHPAVNVTATVGGLPATVQYIGSIATVVEGEFQLNLILSPNVPSGNQAVVVTFGSTQTQMGLTIAVQ